MILVRTLKLGRSEAIYMSSLEEAEARVPAIGNFDIGKYGMKQMRPVAKYETARRALDLATSSRPMLCCCRD
jgi:hypothetical protein